MAGAALSWLAGLGVITVLISVGIGSLLTFLVQSRTQKNVWRHEAAMRKIDEIYGPVYFEVNKISQQLASPGAFYQITYYQPPSGPTWSSISSGYHYFLVDSDLRKELDEFYEAFQHLQEQERKISSIVEGKLLPQLRNAFGTDVEAAAVSATALHPNGRPVGLPSYNFYDPILQGKHPLDYIKEQYPGFSNYEMNLDLQRHGTQSRLFGQGVPDLDARTKLDGIIESVIRELREDLTVVSVKVSVQDLDRHANHLKEEIKRKIDEPWNI